MKLFAVLMAVALALAAKPQAAVAELHGFVTRKGDALFEGGRPFRFISVNIPNLQLIEDNFAPGAATAWAWPNEFELTDALESVRQMGGTVVRTYVLSVRRAGSDMGEHVYVRGPGDFNEEAFAALDRAIEIAGRKGVRLIIPLVDNWKWQGGVGEYAAFRGKPPEAFWTDERVIADFERTVRHVLGRVNTRTGVAYRDDSAILGWETGNELDSPPAWTARIAALMKQLDPNHLVIDGYSLHGVREESLADPNVDVVTTHHYPNTDSTDYVTPILAAREKSRGKKPYFVGEFGFVPVEEVERVYDAVINNGVCGALIWSLRFHHRDGGFYWHFEPAGGAKYKAYHWPGFASGLAYEENRVLELTRWKAFEIRRALVPPLAPPAPPTLLPIKDVAAISWQGSAGARDYIVERAASAEGPWLTSGQGVDDSAVQYRPLYNDESATPGSSYYYRVLARSSGGVSAPSNVEGPVRVEHCTLVDEGRDLTLVRSTSGEVRAVTGEDRRRREDVHRLLVPAGGAVVYEVSGPIVGWRALAFRDGAAAMVASVSADGVAYAPVEVETRDTPADTGDYGYLGRLEQRHAAPPAGVRFLRLEAAGGAWELSRLELHYGPQR